MSAASPSTLVAEGNPRSVFVTALYRKQGYGLAVTSNDAKSSSVSTPVVLAVAVRRAPTSTGDRLTFLAISALLAETAPDRALSRKAVPSMTPLLKWHDDWACGRIREQRRSPALVSWFLFLLTFAVGLQIAAALSLDAGFSRTTVAGLVPLLVSAGLLVWAVRGTWRALRYELAELILDEVPVTSGGRVRGHVHVPSRTLPHPPGVVMASLASIRMVTPRDATVLWREESLVTPDGMEIGAIVTVVPVSFTLRSSSSVAGSYQL